MRTINYRLVLTIDMQTIHKLLYIRIHCNRLNVHLFEPSCYHHGYTVVRTAVISCPKINVNNESRTNQNMWSAQ